MYAANYSASGLESVPGFLLWQVSKLWQRKRSASLKQLGITHVQFVLLANLYLLSTKHTFVTQSLLSQQTKVDMMSVSSVIRSLEKKQLVQRTVHPEDSRAHTLKLTAKGEHTALQGVQHVIQTNEEFFRPLGEKKEIFIHLLQVLITTNDKQQ